MSQILIDDVATHTTPKLMMQAIDDNFDELYLADITNLTAAVNRANHTGTQTASTISDLDTAITNNASVLANTAKEGNVSTDLSVTNTVSSVTVVSSDGTDAVITEATASAAGVMSSSQVNELTDGRASYTKEWKL